MPLMTLNKKIVLISIGSIALSTALALLVQGYAIQSQGIELTHNTMRAAMISAESIRASVASLRGRHAFDEGGMLRQAAQTSDFRQSAYYDTVPTVAAWRSIEKVAQQEGFEFRIPSNHPRNPRNTPTSAEAAILEYLEKSGAPEYFKADRRSNSIVYARPIRLTDDCMFCHGDPATSPTHNGKDALGFVMENWHAGEIHGAFLLTAHLDEVDHVASAKAQADATRTTVLWMIPAALLIAAAFLFYSRRSIVRPLLQVVDVTHRSSVETSEASRQIAAASQSLAQSATEQASSLDFITATLKTVAEKSRHTADAAGDAKSVADRSRQAAQRGIEEIARMDSAMREIRASTQSVSTIAKTIDDVALKTNLLALNASVEAARAGAAGAGFAVVADEVRTLAQQSAAAAKQTTGLVTEALDRTVKGVEICSHTVDRLKEIEEQSKPLDRAVNVIASAAEEQRGEIERVTGSVAELNEAIQGVAANAEQSAAAATEMNAQSDQLRVAMEALTELIG